MSYHTLGSLGATTPAPLTPAEIGAQGGTAFDTDTMTLYVANSKVPVIPALLSAVIVKAVMFGGQKAGNYARSKIFKTATNPPKLKTLVPLAVLAGGAYLLLRNRSAPVDGLGAFKLSRAFKSVTNVGSVVRKISLPSRKILSPVQRILGRSSSGGAAAPAPAPAPMQYQDENGRLISKEEYDRKMILLRPLPPIQPTPIRPAIWAEAVPMTPLPVSPQAVLTRVTRVYYQDAMGNQINKATFDSILERMRIDAKMRGLSSFIQPIYFTRPGPGRSLPVGIYQIPAPAPAPAPQQVPPPNSGWERLVAHLTPEQREALIARAY